MRFTGKTYSPLPTEPTLPSDCTANPSLWANVWNLQALEKRNSRLHRARNDSLSPSDAANNNHFPNSNVTNYYYYSSTTNNNNSLNNNVIMRSFDTGPRLLGGGRRAVLQKSISVDSKITSQRIMLLPSVPSEARGSPSCSPTGEEYPASVQTANLKPRSLECHFDVTRRGTRTVVKSVSFDTPVHNIETRSHRPKNNAATSNVVFNGTYPIDMPVPVDPGSRFSAPTTPY